MKWIEIRMVVYHQMAIQMNPHEFQVPFNFLFKNSTRYFVCYSHESIEWMSVIVCERGACVGMCVCVIAYVSSVNKQNTRILRKFPQLSAVYCVTYLVRVHVIVMGTKCQCFLIAGIK